MGIETAGEDKVRLVSKDSDPLQREREFFSDNLLVRIHFIIEMIWWTGLAPRKFEFPVPGSPISTSLGSPAGFGPHKWPDYCRAKEESIQGYLAHKIEPPSP